MNQKELGELRRRFRPEKCAISRIYGCYVNTNREIISYVDAPLGTLSQEEGEQFLALLKKSLSGTLGKNLIDIVFTTQQVADSDEHRLLSALRESALRDGDVREEFYRKVIDALDMGDSNYLILLAHDAYDVPGRGKDGETMEDGVYKVKTLFEKPDREIAPSNVAILGRYLVTPDIFPILEHTEPGAGLEIQLTDALKELARHKAVYAYEFSGCRYDVGDKLGFLKATVEMALKRPDLHDDFAAYLRSLTDCL